MAITENGIVYPDDYNKAADIPADLKILAESVDINIKKINENIKENTDKSQKNQEDIETNQKYILDIKQKNLEQDTNIQNNKNDIKSAQQEIDELQKENTEIKIENERMKKNIKAIQLIGKASGENIGVNDSSETGFNKIKFSGNYNQEVREGYNILNFAHYVGTVETKSGITREIYNTGINMKGTSTSAINFWLNDLDIKLKAGKINFVIETENQNVTYILKNNSGENIIQTKISSSIELSNDDTISQILIQVPTGITLNLNCNLMIYEGTEKREFEKYGISPSPEFPAEIKTVGSSNVKTEIVNGNLLDFNVVQDSKVTVNADGTITINGKGGFFLKFKKIKAKSNIKYFIKWELISGTISGNYIFMNPFTGNTWVDKDIFVESSSKNNKETNGFWVHANAVFTNAKIKMWISESKNDFFAHQEQTITMPVQQEMLKGDYIDNTEYHEWGKVIFTGTEDINIEDTYEGITQFSVPIKGVFVNDEEIRVLSNYFKGVGWVNSWTKDNSVTVNGSRNIRFMTSKYTTVLDFKTFLKSQYDVGNPVVVYYRLLTPIELDFTEEQKVVEKQIKETLHTYKNVTHIYSDDEVSPMIYVEYTKDPNTQNDNLQKQIDEIKQLLSSTQTSAMLLDNLQTEE